MTKIIADYGSGHRESGLAAGREPEYYVESEDARRAPLTTNDEAMKAKPRIKNVYVWQKPSQMVMVFDQYGEQMPDYQGPLEEVRNSILRDANEHTEYHGGTWKKEVYKVPSI